MREKTIHKQTSKREKRKTKRKMQKEGGFTSLLKEAAKLGYTLGKDKNYRRMGTLGATSRMDNFRRKSWEV